MIGEIVFVAGVGAVAVTAMDKMDTFGTNPDKKFWWERVVWPWTPTPPAVARYPSMIQRPMQLSPKDQLKRAETEILYSTQIANEIKRQNPGLTESKYRVTP